MTESEVASQPVDARDDATTHGTRRELAEIPQGDPVGPRPQEVLPREVLGAGPAHDRQRAGRRRCLVRGQGRQRPRPRRRVRLWQVHDRPPDHPALRPDRGLDDVRGQGPRHLVAQGDDADAQGGPDDLPGPLQLAEPAAHGRHDRRYAAARAQRGPREAGPQPGPRAARGRRPEPRALQPLPQRVLRRPAPAHRHRPGAGPAAEAAGGRRAGVRARRVDPGAGRQPAARRAERVQHRVPVHRPRPGRRPALLPRDRRHVPRQDRRDR